MIIYKLSPSDLTFTWDECKYCFYMKVKHNVVLRGPFPGIFGKMADLTSNFYLGGPANAIHKDLPAGVVKYREQFVRSAPISVPGMEAQCYLIGRFDAVIAFDDGTYGIVDFKTSDPREEHVAFYSRQLTAYAMALENPAPGALHLSPVTRLGLFIITPHRFERTPDDEMIYANRTTWMDVPRDDQAFLGFLGEVLTVLDAPTPPAPSEGCGLCNYRKSMKEFPW
jgi:hypothetical protein